MYTFPARVNAGATTYSATGVKLPSPGAWYVRAKHADSTHPRESYSPWTRIDVSPNVSVTAPKVLSHKSRTYKVYGTIKPRHSSTYLKVYAYRWNGKKYAYVKSYLGQRHDRGSARRHHQVQLFGQVHQEWEVEAEGQAHRPLRRVDEVQLVQLAHHREVASPHVSIASRTHRAPPGGIQPGLLLFRERQHHSSTSVPRSCEASVEVLPYAPMRVRLPEPVGAAMFRASRAGKNRVATADF